MAGKAIKIVGAVVGLPVIALGGTWIWASSALDAALEKTYSAHDVELVSPRPLTEVELDELRAEHAPAVASLETPPPADVATDANAEPVPDPLDGLDLDAIAMERAVARGKHLVEARYVCVECHGTDFGGGTMMDAAPMGTWKGPNLTLGKGSRTADYTLNDWDHLVRHGIKPSGTGAIMPSEDFFEMSDEELTDIVAYIRSLPPVDAEVPAPTYGPVATMLIATGKLENSAQRHPNHQAAHMVLPPPTGVTLEFGEHISKVCTGCHRPDFSGGPILVGDPSWPDARNLTPGPEGLEGWTFENFHTVMMEAKRPDGSDLQPPMTLIPKYAKNWTDVELMALWTYLQSLPPKSTGT